MIKNDYKWLTDVYVAHRGLFDMTLNVPENSLPAFERAAREGFAIETDVQMTKDGVLVVFHDDNLKRMTGEDALLSQKTLDELRQLRLANTDNVIPTFEEFLAAANGVNLVVEIKPHGKTGEVEQKTYDTLKNYEGHYCIESFDPFVLRWFKVHAPQVIRGQLSCGFDGAFGKLKRWLLRDLKLCRWNGAQFIAYDQATVAQNKAVRRWAKKVPILCWTVRSQEQYDRLHDFFDNMIFDSFLPVRKDLDETDGR